MDETKEKKTAMREIGLRPSKSYYNMEREYEARQKKRANQTERNKEYIGLSLTEELEGEILKALASCPVGDKATRVFRQHEDMGLCWHDAFFIMLFETTKTKPIFQGLLKQLMAFMKQDKDSFELTPERTQALANALRESCKSSLDIGIWELLTTALQRYCLLGLLFAKEEVAAKEKTVSALRNRRASIHELEFDKIHELLKHGMYCEIEEGIPKSALEHFFLQEMSALLGELTKELTIQRTSEIPTPEKTIGYYFTIQTKESEPSKAEYRMFYRYEMAELQNSSTYWGGAHMISFFVCEGDWYLYDNEVGIVQLPAEIAASVQKEGIHSVQMLRDKTHFTYRITLLNKNVVEVKQERITAYAGEKEEIFKAETILSSSARLVLAEAPNAGAAAAAGAGAGKGGRRKKRITRKMRNNKQRRVKLTYHKN